MLKTRHRGSFSKKINKIRECNKEIETTHTNEKCNSSNVSTKNKYSHYLPARKPWNRSGPLGMVAEPKTSGTNKTWGTVSALEEDRLETGEKVGEDFRGYRRRRRRV